MKFTYSVIDTGIDHIFTRQFVAPPTALTVDTLCTMYNNHNLFDDDSPLTTTIFRQHGGQIGDDSIAIEIGELTIRLQRYVPAKRLCTVDC